MNWTPICILPNIELGEPVESDLLALVPFCDPRVQEISEENFHKFLGRFTDPFGKKIHPALIFKNKDLEKDKIPNGLIANFRNIIVASTVPYARSRKINDNPNPLANYSNYFSICPWMISSDLEYVTGSSPAFKGTHCVDKYQGQSSPELSPVKLSTDDFDGPILCELLKLWNDIDKKKNERNWQNLALFHSLNMAYQALMIPVNADAGSTFYDYGRIIALWVAAFEILVHPENKQVKKEIVFKHLHGVSWIESSLSEKRFKLKKGAFVNLACWVYDQMYTSRNNFLHGNPVKESDPDLWNSFCFAPVVYRLLLSKYLNLSREKRFPEIDDELADAKYPKEKIEFENPQREAESALLLAERQI